MNLEKLKEHIGLPDWERRLVPLFLFKGSKPYFIRASFNCAYAMYLSECESFHDGIKLLNKGAEYFHKKDGKTRWHHELGGPTEISHLCGRHGNLQHSMLRSIFERLRSDGGIKLTDSLDKGFSEYIEWLYPGTCILQPVPLGTLDYREGVTAWWREKIARKHKPREPRVELQYPYIQKPTAEHQLLLDVHHAIPAGIPHELRADLCQDLIVAVLSGETTVENIPDVIASYAKQARKILPDRWRTVSLNAVLPGTDDFRYIDSLHACEPDFAPPLIDKIEHQENVLGLPAAAFRHGDFVANENNARRVITRSPRADRMERK